MKVRSGHVRGLSVLLAALLLSCGGGSKGEADVAEAGGDDAKGDAGPEAEVAGADATELTDAADAREVPAPVDVVEAVELAEVPADVPPDGDAAETPDAEVAGFVALPEALADTASPSCAKCFILLNETWDGAADLKFPTKGDYTQVVEGATFYFRPWVRFRMPHPGKVKRLFVMTQGAGPVEMQLSTGFPGGHYPCLDESTGEDSYPFGQPFVMETSAEAGWRVFDVESAGMTVGGLDEFMVIFRQGEEARVGLSYPVPAAPGDYGIQGGLIADAPGDDMKCFSSMTNFADEAELPLLWVVRAEIEAEEVMAPRWFEDKGGEGLNVGGHAAFGDFDNDGDEDLLSNGSLWQNDGNGLFTNVTVDAGLSGLGGETVFGDFDNDGFRDVLGVGGKAMLYRNLGDGTFADVTAGSGIFIDASSQGVAWVDVDQDGYVDFYAASYGTLADPEVPTRDYLFISNGDGTFYDFTGQAGMPVSPPKVYHGRGVCTADYDGDLDPDIYVGNYRLDPNQLWQNQGGLSGFKEVGGPAGVKGWFELWGGYGHTIGPSFGDLDGDGVIDLIVPNLAHPRFIDFSDRTTVYINEGDGTFAGFQTPERGILYDETHSDSVLLDVDNDGDLDVFLTAVYEGRRSYLYTNDGTAMFKDETYHAGIAHFNGWGCAAADVDGDGDVDLVANRLFRNQQELAGHWLEVKLTGGATPGNAEGFSNRDAIGAVVTVEAGGQKLLRQVEGGKGTGCQNSSVLHFGLGSAAVADKLDVLWPSGKTTTMTQVPADQRMEIAE